MLVAWLYLAGALIGVWFTVQAFRPTRLPSPVAIPSFFAGWLTNELAFHHLAWQAIITVVYIALGALQHWAGWVALALTLLQWIALVHIIRLAGRSRQVVEGAVREALRGDPEFEGDDPQLSWTRLVVPAPRHPDVRSERGITFARAGARDLELDVHRHRDHDPGERAPCLVYAHGGGWTIGFRERQGLPLMYELASRGWVCVSVDYRLSPFATWPDHVVDVKRGIAWVREHADELGIDPDFVALAGNSAGGHLTAVAALSDDRRLQSGFEDADTRVQAAVPFYGVYDFLNRERYREEEFVEWASQWVIKADPDEDPEAWELASPIDLIHADAPPFFVIHGARDSLTSPREAEAFVTALREVSKEPVAFAELPGAQHAFDVFPSLRTARVVHGVVRFLEHTWAQAKRRARTG